MKNKFKEEPKWVGEYNSYTDKPKVKKVTIGKVVWDCNGFRGMKKKFKKDK